MRRINNYFVDIFWSCAERGVDNFVVGINSNIERKDSFGVLQKGAREHQTVFAAERCVGLSSRIDSHVEVKCRITKRVNDLELSTDSV